jgi:hypothetical protein
VRLTPIATRKLRSYRRAVGSYYGSFLPAPSAARPAILDLASSWISHLPSSFTKATANIAAIGMNRRELEANPVLSSFDVQDLNEDPTFKNIASDSQDAVICSVSIG